MNEGSRSQIKVGLMRQAGEFELDPESDEKALKNSDQGWGMAGSAFLKGHYVGWAEGNSGWSWRQMMSKEAVWKVREDEDLN